MRWTFKPIPSIETINHLVDVLQIDTAIATLLVQRGITSFDAAKRFFRPTLEDLHDPFLMKDMDKAVARIKKAFVAGERIMVYGDYDVDGTTAVALMASYLQNHYSNIETYIPDRYTEGYGISYKGIEYAHDNEITLIIALDCGIKAVDKVACAKEKGIDFIICDHHRPGEIIPEAVAVLDPKRNDCSYPYKELCGCGVGFKLIQALSTNFEETIEDLIPYLDLVATAIGADIVPITGENRILAYYGLKVIREKPRTGFKAIIKEMKRPITTITDVVFTIAPRINAAGRMKHGIHAVKLLTEENIETAIEFASEIENYNNNRKEKDQLITKEALTQIEENNDINKYTTVVYDPNWHKGVIGIVASRLIETYYRPTLVFTKSGDKFAASARSVKGFDVYEALEACSEFIEQFGGHKYAAGLTLKEDQFENFKNKFEEVVGKTIDKKLLMPEITLDIPLDFDKITPRFYRILKQFAPFGPNNMAPIFMSKNIYDSGHANGIGEDEKHLKCKLYQKQNEISFNAIGFNLGNKTSLLENKKTVKIAYHIDENVWKGITSLQLRLKDIKENTFI